MIINIDKVIPFISLGVLGLLWYSVLFNINDIIDPNMKPLLYVIAIFLSLWLSLVTYPFLYWL